MATTADEVWQLLGELVESQKQFDQQLSESRQETDRRMQETDRLFAESKQEADREIRELRQQTRELGKQIGGLGKKFGSFTEGLALPSMEKILRERFQMEVISPSVRVSKAGNHIEVDVLAYSNGEVNTAIVVEVKSHPREESILQLKNLLERFRFFFPEHSDKQVYGILAAVDLSGELKERILQEGLYVARIHDEVFELDTPTDFQPKVW